MSNYVWHRVICRKDMVERYFIDTDPFGDGRPLERPYLSFNRLFGVKDLGEYSEKYGVHISYGYSFSWEELPDGLCEVKFVTRWEYPIRAIVRLLELSHDSVWFAVEENHIYISKFYWSNGVKEDVMYIAEEYDEWLGEHEDLFESLVDPDEEVWHFLPTATGTWLNWESADGFSRYLDVSAVDVELPPFFK